MPSNVLMWQLSLELSLPAISKSLNNSVKITEPIKLNLPLNLQNELSKRDNVYSEVMKNGL